MIWLIALLFSVTGLFAQSNLLNDADSLFSAAEYERVELMVLRAELQTGIPDSQKVALQLLGGYSLIMLNREVEARRHFEQALEADSTLTLDPVEVSPKFRVVFDDVRSEWLSRKSKREPEQKLSHERGRVRARAESHIMNLIIPGSGFVREGRTVRGVAHIIVQTVSAALWISELSQNNSARKEYLAADSTADAVRLYKNYDDHHRQMWTFGLSAVGVYLASQVDLALWRTPTTSFEVLPAESAVRFKYNF